MTQAVHDEPSRLLRNSQMLSECCRRDPLGVVRHDPNCHEPCAEGEFRIFEDRSDFDRKSLATGAALERLAVREMIDAIFAAVRAELPVAPAQLSEMVEARLLVRKGREQVEEAVDLADHESSPLLPATLFQIRFGSSSYICG